MLAKRKENLFRTLIVLRLTVNNYFYVTPYVTLILQWLQGEFLSYFNEWEKSVEERKGCEEKDKKMMMIAQETLYGIKVKVNGNVLVL